MSKRRRQRSGFKRAPARKAAVPDLSDRISVDSGGSAIEAMRGLFSGLTWMSALFPFAIYEVMDELFKTEPYFAKFKRDTLSLGNSGHEIEIDASTEQKAQSVLQAVNDFAARCYPGAGADGLFNGLFSQLCRAGGLCVEFPPFPDLSGVKRGYLARMRTLRFRRGEDGEIELGQLQNGVFVPLNPAQTSFVAAETFDENPYPIPPALAALGATATNQKFEEGIRAWTKKVGSFGLLQATAERPEMLEKGETDEEYWQRTRALLKEFTQTIARNMQDGVAAAWDNVDFKFTNTNAGAAGAKEMAQMILQSLFAGLLRDPVFFGHNWGTTETFASVVYRIMAAQIRNFQLCVKRAYEHALRLELALKAMGDIGVSLRFNLTDTLDEFMASEAKAMERAQYTNEFNSQICSLEEVRDKLGYEDSSAKSGAFIASFEKKTGLYVLKRPKPFWPGHDFGKSNFTSRGRNKTNSRGPSTSAYADKRNAVESAREYLFRVKSILSEAGKIGVEAVYTWALDHDVPDPEEFVAEALQRFTTATEESIDEQSLIAIAKDHIATIWAYGKRDSELYPDWDKRARGVGVTLGEPDWKAIDYLAEKVDRFYVSKYVSNSPQRSRQIANFLQSQYLEKGLGRGKSPAELRAFREQFGDVVGNLSEHASRVIIDTGVSRAQNWSNILSLSEERITEFKITGPNDRLTCRYCRNMLGRVFKTEIERARIEKIIESGSEDISKFDPFITSRFGTKAGFATLERATDVEVQESGMVAPPIHPLCRHGMVAVLKSAMNTRFANYYRSTIVAAMWPKAA